MKKTLLQKTFKGTIITIIFVISASFFLVLICGVPMRVQPGSAYREHLCQCISIQEALKELPSIILIAILGGAFYFPIEYGYHKDKEKNKKR